MNIDKYNDGKNNNLTIDDLKERLLKIYRDNKYNIEDEYERILYNEISIIVNYKFKEISKNKIYGTKLFTELSQIMIKDLFIDILQLINKVISCKYEIKGNELRTRGQIDEYNKFIDEMEVIKEEKLFEWILEELLYESERMRGLLIVKSLDEFLRVEKILSNSKRKLNTIDIDSKDEAILEIVEIFYEFRDKLSKNKFVNKDNQIYNKLMNAVKEIVKQDDTEQWKEENGGFKKVEKHSFKSAVYIETKEIKTRNNINKNYIARKERRTQK